MAGPIISELARMPAHIPGELHSEFQATVHSLLSRWNEENQKKQKKPFQKTKVGACTSFREHQQPSIRHFQQEPVCRNVSLPGLAPVDGCQDILCVVNRRLHYAGAVWVVNQRACFGRLQGNVEHLRKAAGLLSTGLTKGGVLDWSKPSRVMGARLAARPATLVSVQLLENEDTQGFFLFIFVVKPDGQHSQKQGTK